ncbi:MAG: restriction endonuclease subunit S, partial [bacterium]|nr:restriction endonuclease subunit S [bacterium]
MRFEWEQLTLDEVCVLITDGAHSSPPSVDTGEYMASVKDFTEYGFDFSSCRKISSEDYGALRKQGCVPEIGDILVGKDGARFFEDIIIYRQQEKPALLSSIAILRVDRNKLTPEFLYYTLKSPFTKKDVRDNYGSGSAIPRIVLKDFKRMPISFPKLAMQRKVTAICECLDNKIAINTAINKNLEEQAKAIFKSWFV